MTLDLQGETCDTSIQILPIKTVYCKIANCHATDRITGAEEVDLTESIEIGTNPEVALLMESLEAGMRDAGWENGYCPLCLETRPNLAKQDHEDDQADEDRGAE